MSASKYTDLPLRELSESDHSAPDSIIYIVVDICYAIADFYDLSLKSHRRNAAPVVENAVSYLIGKIKALSSGSILYDINSPQALFIVYESSRMDPVKDFLTNMSERRMSKIMPERNGLCKIFIISKYPRCCAGYLGYLKSMSQTCSVVITLRSKKDLRLMYQSSESF